MTHDNQHLDISGTMSDMEGFAHALALTSHLFGIRKVHAFRLVGDAQLVVSYLPITRPEGWTILPSPLSLVAMVPILESWLRETKQRAWHLDHDGSNGPGWRVFVEAWGRVANFDHVIGFEAIWCWYGK